MASFPAFLEVLVMRGRMLASAMLVLAFVFTISADDKPIERTDVDARVVKSVYATALLGTEIFNRGKHEECFRLYQGVLIGLQPLLDHRPRLMASVKDKMEKAAGIKAVEGAFVLREALDEIQNEIAPASKSDAKVEPKPEAKKAVTLWDRLGGTKTVQGVVKDFLAAATSDEKVNFSRGGKYKHDAKAMADMEQLFLELFSELAGGPLPYTSKRTMKDVHTGMKITDSEFDAMAALLRKTFEKQKVGKMEIDEFMDRYNRTRTVIVEVKGKGK
jgi:hemoglobin